MVICHCFVSIWGYYCHAHSPDFKRTRQQAGRYPPDPCGPEWPLCVVLVSGAHMDGEVLDAQKESCMVGGCMACKRFCLSTVHEVLPGVLMQSEIWNVLFEKKTWLSLLVTLVFVSIVTLTIDYWSSFSWRIWYFYILLSKYLGISSPNKNPKLPQPPAGRTGWVRGGAWPPRPLRQQSHHEFVSPLDLGWRECRLFLPRSNLVIPS